MLAKLTVLTCLIFSATYPLCFWISAREPLKEGFHKFHIGLPCFILGVTSFFLFRMDLPFSIQQGLAVWLILLLTVAYLSWEKAAPSLINISGLSILGFIVFICIQGQWINFSPVLIISSLLAGIILSLAFYCMNLGHWYLNVHGLPLWHLKNAMNIFWACVLIRFIWNMIRIFTDKIQYGGDYITIIHFMYTMDGFLLLIAVFFGTVFPLVSLYFVKGTLDVKNTQSATGILYVILSAVLIGDLSYKYFLLKFGIFL